MSQKKYIAILSFICALPYTLLAQIDNAGIMDRHFYGILFPQVYKELVSTKIDYPGLRDPENYSVCAGLLPDASGESWAALYGWGEWANGPAVAGVRLGNLRLNSASRRETFYAGNTEYELYVNERDFSIRAAAWLTPFRNSSFKGISVTYDALSNRREAEYEALGVTAVSNLDSAFFGVISLIQLNANLHLRAGIGSRYYAEDMRSEERSADGIFVGLLDRDNRTLELRVSNSYNYVEDFDGEQVNDTVNIALIFSGGKVIQYHKHRFFYGFKGEGGVSLLSETGAGAGRFEYWRHIRNIKHSGKTFDAELSAPLIFDARLFKTVHCILSINPHINYSHTGHPKKSKSTHTLNLTSPHPLLSFYGTIGKNVEFAINPSIENEVFFSAAEVRYKF
ncbi:MAG: hypothetical protein LBB56_07890 [Chitinispirillales bacterium]|jgi:hypothetical protein|nr:hypothetical protein [Chitinispirillales bacterium]